MKVEDLISMIDTDIRNEQAESVLDKVRVENYHAGKLEGYQLIRDKIVKVISEEIKQQEEAKKNKDDEEKKDPPSKKK